jgi:hypothetical protein
MKVILIGYPGSQCIVPASKYLTDKYLLGNFEVNYINHKGKIECWSSFLIGHLTALYDPYVILALDDYLVADFDWDKYFDAEYDMGETDVVCMKLCNATSEELEEYPVTTQYCIWDRKYLIWLLEQVNTPWEFEIKGSAIFKQGDKKVIHHPCLEYFTNSSISSRWEGVRLDGLKEEDVKYIKENNLINE